MHCINDIYKIKRSICQSNTNNKYTSTYRIHKSFILNNDNRQVRIYSHRYVTKNQRRKIKDIFVSALSSLPTDRGENQEGKINIKEAISKYCTTITVRGRFCRTGEERRGGRRVQSLSPVLGTFVYLLFNDTSPVHRIPVS